MTNLNQPSLSGNLVIVLAGLLSGIAVAFGGLWIAAETGIIARVDNWVLMTVAAGCVLLGVMPWAKKKPTPEGLAK